MNLVNLGCLISLAIGSARTEQQLPPYPRGDVARRKILARAGWVGAWYGVHSSSCTLVGGWDGGWVGVTGTVVVGERASIVHNILV